MKSSEFVFDFAQLLYYKCHKTNPNCGGSYIDSPDWVKNKKATINPIPYAVTVALNHEKPKSYLQRISKIKPFINKHNWEGINFPSEKNDLGKIEKDNNTIALNVFYAKKEKN